MNPKISIITINFNNIEGLKKTFESVYNQEYKNKEFIVIDGNSNDGAKEFLTENKNKINHLVIENDHGIYDAMNKGLKIATGDYCIFLNSGDTFKNINCLKIITSYTTNPNIVYFCTASITNGKIGWKVPPVNKDVKKWLVNKIPNHQSILFPKSFYLRNYYDLFFKIAGDAEYIKRAKLKLEFEHIPHDLIEFNLGGISNNSSSFSRVKIQILESVIIHLKYSDRKLFYLFYVPFKFIVKFLFKKLLNQRYDKFIKIINKYK